MRERMHFERELELLRISLPEYDTPATGTPVMQLDRIEIAGQKTPIVLKSPGVRKAYLCTPLPGPQAEFSIKGWVLIEKDGVRRAIKPADKKAFPRLAVGSRVYVGGGVSIAGGGVGQLKDEGAFSVAISLVVKDGRRVRIELSPEWKGDKGASQDLIFEYNPLECFLALIDPREKARPSSQTRLEFLGSVRKIFQPAQGSSLASYFDEILFRNRKVKPLFAAKTAEWNRIHQFETIEINGAQTDIGHVLIGIEASRRQQPGLGGSGLPYNLADDETEATLTWGGDLGGVLAWVAQETPAAAPGKAPNLQFLLTQKASHADLTGDIDGINIGAVYDDKLSLGDNLRKYYEAAPFRRFNSFVASAKGWGPPLLSLKPGKPPKIDPKGRAVIARYLHGFVHRYLSRPGNKKFQGMTDAQRDAARAIGAPGSKESDAVVDYFFQFLEAGLAKEP